MKTKAVPSGWIYRSGLRLDSPPYLSGALEARLAVENGGFRRQPLRDLTAGHDGGIYNGPQFRRNYVDSPEHGVPFVGSSSMLMADLTNLPYLRKKDALSPKLSYLRLKPGMTLISCSGTIGRMVYVRPDMDGIWSSQHIMKVAPDPERIPPGYLYAFLSSRFGIPMVTSGTYGAIIQHIEPEHIANLPIPRLDSKVEAKVHTLITKAADLRATASTAIAEVVSELPQELGLRSLAIGDVTKFSVASVDFADLRMRFDAPFHCSAAQEVEDQIDNCDYPVMRLVEILERYFKPPIFKRLWVDDPAYGSQFISGSDAYRFQSDDPRYVSVKTPNFDEFILHEGWVVFQAAGQIYGLFGQPLFVNGWLEELFCADDVYRLVPHSEVDGAYLFAFLKTPHGQVLIKRQACGNSIPRVWDPHIEGIRVPWPDEAFRRRVADTVITAHSDVYAALQAEREAIQMVERSIEDAA